MSKEIIRQIARLLIIGGIGLIPALFFIYPFNGILAIICWVVGLFYWSEGLKTNE